MVDSTERSVISALIRDHRQIEELLARLQTATDPGERHKLLDEVTTAIVQHADAEDKYVYDVLRGAIPRGAIDIDKQVAAHLNIKTMLEELNERSDAASGEFEQLVTALIAEVRQNIVNEEHGVFAWLVQWVDESTLAELGDQVQALRHQGVGG
jgi:hemerythrin-like domain-containing protein